MPIMKCAGTRCRGLGCLWLPALVLALSLETTLSASSAAVRPWSGVPDGARSTPYRLIQEVPGGPEGPNGPDGVPTRGQATGDRQPAQRDESSPHRVENRDVNDASTNSVVRNLQEIELQCGTLPVEYRIDCIRHGLEWAAGVAPTGVYDDARRSLSKAAFELGRIVDENVDESKPAIVADTGRSDRWRTMRRYRAIREDRLAAANEAAQAIITQTATELLRSYENSEKRRVHYARMAAALNSTKRLLRSA